MEKTPLKPARILAWIPPLPNNTAVSLEFVMTILEVSWMILQTQLVLLDKPADFSRMQIMSRPSIDEDAPQGREQDLLPEAIARGLPYDGSIEIQPGLHLARF